MEGYLKRKVILNWVGGGLIVGGRSDFLAFFYRPHLDTGGWPDLLVNLHLQVCLLLSSPIVVGFSRRCASKSLEKPI